MVWPMANGIWKGGNIFSAIMDTKVLKPEMSLVGIESAFHTVAWFSDLCQ